MGLCSPWSGVIWLCKTVPLLDTVRFTGAVSLATSGDSVSLTLHIIIVNKYIIQWLLDF